jgi:hypothetical protein
LNTTFPISLFPGVCAAGFLPLICCLQNCWKVGYSQLHPADIADIIEELDIRQRTAVLQSLDVETAAETLEEDGSQRFKSA